MKLLFENWREYLEEGRRVRIATLRDYDITPELAADGFKRLSTYIANNYNRFGKDEIKAFEKKIFNSFFKGKSLEGKYPITGFEFEPDSHSWLSDASEYINTRNGYMLFVDNSPFYAHAFPDENGEYLDYSQDVA